MLTTARSGLLGLVVLVGVGVGVLVFASGVAAAAGTGTNLVLAWGDNGSGQLGNGTTTNSDLPVNVKLPHGAKVAAVSAGGNHSLALTSTGSVLAWGDNTSGELGNATTSSSDVPVSALAPFATKALAVSAGTHFSLALTSTGQVLAWGDNTFGELGDGTTTGSDLPVKVRLPKGTKVSAVSAGNGFSLALTSTGHVLAWGENFIGQLGDATTTGPDNCHGTACSTTPVKVKLPKGIKVVAVSAGFLHSLALTSTGQVLAWGEGGDGELGNGTTTASDLPVKVKLPKATKVTAVSSDDDTSLALTSAGRALTWGGNRFGQLGDGTTSSTDLPVKVKLPKGIKLTAVSSGFDFGVALTSTGQILAWGDNFDGALGHGTTTGPDNCGGEPCSTTPVKVKLPTGDKATAVRAGAAGDHSLALVHRT